MNMTLYKATELAKLENFVDPETGEMDIAAFDAANIMLAVTGMLKNAENDLKAKRQSLERRVESLHRYLMDNMKMSGTTEIKAVDGSFTAKLYLERDESVVLDEGVVFPPELCDLPKPPEPSKTKIKEAILRGEPVQGATIVRKDRLTIK